MTRHNYYYKISLDDGTEYVQQECPKIGIVSDALLEEMRINDSQIEDGVTITKVDEDSAEYDIELEELGLNEDEIDLSEEE